ncbi:MAG TPA: hypothetical protein PKD53_07680 [Chloroflexaceae bacterium]|nr:hypothetical protein [Chloroflexaceae bacterium]
MTPTDVVQRTYLERRREALLASRGDVVHRAIAARATVEALPTWRLCPKEVARLENLAREAEWRSAHLARALAAIGAELALP